MPSLYTIDINRGIKSAALLYKTHEGREILKQEQQIRDSIRENGNSIINISKHSRPLDWFIDPRVSNNKVSAAEEMINKILNQYRVEYYNEVSFYGLQLSSGGYARYDWWFPKLMLCCEYDGQLSHSDGKQIAKDRLKDKFCGDNRITLHRWNKKHYYHMEDVIAHLMGSYGIHKK